MTTANIVRHRVMIITSVPTSGQKEADLAAWIWHAHKPCLVIWFAFFLISAYRDLDFTLFRICWRFVRSLFIHGLRILLLFQLSFSLCLFVCLFVCFLLIYLLIAHWPPWSDLRPHQTWSACWSRFTWCVISSLPGLEFDWGAIFFFAQSEYNSCITILLLIIGNLHSDDYWRLDWLMPLFVI